MSKSVYSLVLSDEVVRKIDALAYASGANRSAMINRILGEYVSYVTPEERVSSAFDRMTELLIGAGDVFQMPARPSGSMMSMRSAIAYKYNPSVRYSVELSRSQDITDVGTLKVQLRTQNESLISLMNDFLSVFTAFELKYTDGTVSEYGGGRFIRRLILRENGNASLSAVSGETVGEIISDYVKTFDAAVKAYFYSLGDRHAAVKNVAEIYGKYISDCRFII